MRAILLVVTISGLCSFVAFWFGFVMGRKTERDFIAYRSKEVDRLHNGWTLCDACGKPITDDQKDVGHDCNLHEWCVDEQEAQDGLSSK